MSILVFLLFFSSLLDSVTAVAVLQTPDNITGLTGDEVTLRCQFVELLNEQIVWFYTNSNEILTRDSILETADPDKLSRYTIAVDDNEWYNLTIRNLSYTDEGEYKCGYSRNRGDGSGNVYLGSAFIDVVTRPSFPVCNVVYPGNIDFPVIGNSVSIECSAPGGDPNPEITWFRDDVVESIMTEVDMLDLQFFLQELDRGVTFRCDIYSPALESIESCDVLPFPREPAIDIGLTTVGLVNFGSNITFQCSAVGDLSLSILSFVTSLASGRFSVNAAGNIMTILNFGQQDLEETITCKVTYDEFDNPFTSTVELDSLLPDLEPEDPGDNDDSPNKEDSPTLTIVLVVLGVIVVILVITALIWYNRKKIMHN